MSKPVPSIYQLQIELKALLVDDLEKALLRVNEVLIPSSIKHDNTLLMIARYRRITKWLHTSIISYQEADRVLSDITSNLLYYINSLTEQDLNPDLLAR
jgi:hypothetical protein